MNLPPIDPKLELEALKMAVLEVLQLLPASEALKLTLHAQWVLSQVVQGNRPILPDGPIDHPIHSEPDLESPERHS